MWRTGRTKENKIRLCWVCHKGQFTTDRELALKGNMPMPEASLYEGYALALHSNGKWYFENKTSLDEMGIIVLAWCELPMPYRKGIN